MGESSSSSSSCARLGGEGESLVRPHRLSFASRLSKGTIALSNIPVNSYMPFFPIGPIMSKTLGSEIKRLRKALGMTQKQLADTTELSQGYIAQIETDVRQAKYADTMNKLCAALKVPLDHFVQWVSPGLTVPPPPSAVLEPVRDRTTCGCAIPFPAHVDERQAGIPFCDP